LDSDNDIIESDNSVAFFFWEMAEQIERENMLKKNDVIEVEIVDLSQGNKKYWKYSSNLVLPFHKNHDL